MATITSGEIGKKRKMTQDLLQGFYHSCFEPDGATGKAFAADAIISNPPAFAHVHVAEALGLPLLMSFSKSCRFATADTLAMPWTSTTAFKHPLVNIAATNAQMGLTNYFSFGMAEML
jgi:sterol 3beta-glucosyltransferase